MKKYLLFIAFFACLQASLPADNLEGSYISGFGGFNFFKIFHNNERLSYKTQNGFVGGFSAGYKFCNGIRFEGEFSYRENNAKRWLFFFRRLHYTFKTYSVMINGIYDFDFFPEWTPYIGAGIGCSILEIKKRASNNLYACEKSQSENRATLQAIAGISYGIFTLLHLGIEYRYLKAWSLGDDHSVVLSLRQFF